MIASTFDVAGFKLYAARLYDPATHMWIEVRDHGVARVGLDPIGARMRGDVSALTLKSPGTPVRRGHPLGEIGCERLGGPLPSPISGIVFERNDILLHYPGLLNVPSDGQWFVEISLKLATIGEFDDFLQGEERVAPWFAEEARRELTAQ